MPSLNAPPLLDRNAALFLDFDGTLVAIAATPDAITVPPDLPDRLTRLAQAFNGALATVTGRPIEQIDTFLHPYRGLAAGVHGQQMRLDPDGPVQVRPDPPGLADLCAQIEAFAAQHSGVQVERKPGAVGLHYRGAPEAEAACSAAMERAMAGLPGLTLLRGKMVLEARASDAHKGAAVERLMALPVCAGRAPVFVGDDRTDEDGFAACQRLGGFAVKIGPEDSGADYRLADEAAVQAWLTQSVAGLTQGFPTPSNRPAD